MASDHWIVVCDFDGTLCHKDIGNELCEEFAPEKFRKLLSEYRQDQLTLREYQRRMWNGFPLNESQFRQQARKYASLRDGFTSFLEKCRDQQIPFYIASCGLRPYIEGALEETLPSHLHAAIHGIFCNQGHFDEQKLVEILPPAEDLSSPYPLDKGALSLRLKAQHPGCHALGIGNGSSDRSFWPSIDRLAATESLARWCGEKSIPFLPFESFSDLMNCEIFT